MKKILYVEDDALIARVYSQKLEAAGFEVVIASDGLVAVQRLREYVPDLVVLDLLMPKLTGVDVLKFMRGQEGLKHTRIIVFSNSFLSNLIEQVAAIGVEEALVKASVTPNQLVEIVGKTLERPAQRFLTADDIAAHLAGDASGTPVTGQVTVVSPKPNPVRVPPIMTQSPVEVPANKPPSAADPELRAQREFREQSQAILNGMGIPRSKPGKWKICGAKLVL